MKKQILVLALILAGITGSSFAAGNPDINKYALVSFHKQFSDAQNVQWENNSGFLKASFEMNNQTLYAYYSAQGELLAVTRYISTNQLPVQLLITLKKEFADYWISDLFEIRVNGDTSYYVTVEDGSRKKILKSDDTSTWEEFKSLNK